MQSFDQRNTGSKPSGSNGILTHDRLNASSVSLPTEFLALGDPMGVHVTRRCAVPDPVTSISSYGCGAGIRPHVRLQGFKVERGGLVNQDEHPRLRLHGGHAARKIWHVCPIARRTALDHDGVLNGISLRIIERREGCFVPGQSLYRSFALSLAYLFEPEATARASGYQLPPRTTNTATGCWS